MQDAFRFSQHVDLVPYLIRGVHVPRVRRLRGGEVLDNPPMAPSSQLARCMAKLFGMSEAGIVDDAGSGTGLLAVSLDLLHLHACFELCPHEWEYHDVYIIKWPSKA